MDSGNSLFNNEVQELLNKLKQWDFSNVSGSMDFSGLDEEQPGEARELLLLPNSCIGFCPISKTACIP